MSVAQWRWAGALAIVLAIGWTHGALLSHGFTGDDYFVLRQWTGAEIRSVLTGSWDPLGFQDEYHRPITALYESALYPLFHFNARAMHAVSLIEIAIVAAGLAWFVAGELRSPMAGCLAGLVLVVHPALPESTTAWIFNQMSLLADMTVVGALLMWRRVRSGPASGWWPVWLIVVVSFFIKEDGAMLLPALLTLQWWRAVSMQDVPRPSRALIASALGVGFALAAIRLSLFPVFTHWPPALAEKPAWFYPRMFVNGPYRVLLRLPDRSLAGAFGNIAVAASVLAAAVVVFRQRLKTPAAVLFVGSLLLMFWVNLPLFLVTGPTRVHLVTLAGALVIASGAIILLDIIRSSSMRRVVAVAVAAALLSLSLGSRIRSQRFEPCTEWALAYDEDVLEWPTVAPELKAWFGQKRIACAAGTYQALPVDFAVSPVLPLRR